MPCCPPNCAPPGTNPGLGCWPGGKGPEEPSADWILLRASASCVCDDDGVAWAEPEGELEAPCEGEAVPELESFFLDDLLSLFRESCSD